MPYSYYTDDVTRLWRIDPDTGIPELFQHGTLQWVPVHRGMAGLQNSIVSGEANAATEAEAARTEAIMRWVRATLDANPGRHVRDAEAEAKRRYDAGTLTPPLPRVIQPTRLTKPTLDQIREAGQAGYLYGRERVGDWNPYSGGKVALLSRIWKTAYTRGMNERRAARGLPPMLPLGEAEARLRARGVPVDGDDD